MHPETQNKNLQNHSKEPEITNSTGSALNVLSSAIFYLAILFFIIGFNFSDVMVGNWYQQFFPNLGGRQINDITFTDSLNGYAITNRLSLTDTSFILRTTNRGDNWLYTYSDSGVIYSNIQFINQNTGFVSGYIYAGGSFKILKTTNMGLSWFNINAPFDVAAYDMYTLNQDTIWLVDKESLSGGVYFTSNGGLSWTRQFNVGTNNPNHIYMYNRNIGFVSQAGVGGRLYKTTNSGVNWTLSAGDYFTDMYFADSLTGWKCSGLMKKTTDGGLSWLIQELPTGGNIINSGIIKFSNVNRDTIWGVGGHVFWPGYGNRGMIYRTTNGGNNWLYQIPDTSINIGIYSFIKFIDKDCGWAYSHGPGVHTTTGGDPIWYTDIKQISSEVPVDFILEQNYPNPFNPTTKIRYQIPKRGNVTLKVFDVTGRLVSILVNQVHMPGEYETEFDASSLSSGIYFYRIEAEYEKAQYTFTKKMILVK